MRVAVITRTKNRPIMLPRALSSVMSQTYTDFEWCIINDGGDKRYVDEVAVIASKANIAVQVIHNTKSLGMEAASNKAISSTSAELIVIHDDDDSWKPEFLSKTVAFLEKNTEYLGVVTQGNKVTEVVSDDHIRIKKSELLNPSLQSVDISMLAVRNQFPPISFVFRRTAYEVVGGFDETLPVLGDWDFNLRLLINGDIGVIPEPLANHHHRFEVAKGDEAYGNTVTIGINKHLEWETKYRNAKLREDLEKGKAGLGHILSQGKQTQILYKELEQLRVAGDAWRSVIRLNERFGLGLVRRFFAKFKK